MAATSSGERSARVAPQIVTDQRPVGALGRRQQMHERQGPLALVQVAENLLAVQLARRRQGSADRRGSGRPRRSESRSAPTAPTPPSTRTDHRTDPQRVDRGVPAGLVHDQIQVVLWSHVLDLIEPANPPPSPDPRACEAPSCRTRPTPGRPDPGRVCRVARRSTWPATIARRVAGVERRRHPVRRRKRRPTTTHLTSVGDIVMNQKSIVQQFDCHGDAHISSGLAPNARPADRHRAGRSALPGRDGYSRIGPYSHWTGSPSGIASSMDRRTILPT